MYYFIFVIRNSLPRVPKINTEINEIFLLFKRNKNTRLTFDYRVVFGVLLSLERAKIGGFYLRLILWKVYATWSLLCSKR